jgi:hypothetical protein
MPAKRISEKIKIDRGKATRKLARERVGQPPVERVITPRTRKKPKYPAKDEMEAET